MTIKIEKPTAAEIAAMKRCPIWSKEESVFDWAYDAEETCYLLEGEVEVTAEDGSVVAFGAGDLVTFPKGLKCVWDVRRAVRKHYRFG
ncbi:MAG: cupin domain-containing protein [Rhodospirillales bacterium]